MHKLILRSPYEAFERQALEACMLVSASTHTRRAYWNDVHRWLEFCQGEQVDPTQATPIVVAAWIEEMKRAELAPKTRNRRLSSLASVYGWLYRNKRVASNPFSATEGVKRESAHVIRPTPIAEAKTVAAALRDCDDDPSHDGVRDAAILRVLWVTGARRSSLVEITHERITRDASGYTCTVPAKGGKALRLWWGGKAATAVDRLVATQGVRHGAVFRKATGSPMTERDVWRVVTRRARRVGGVLSPHSFRVAFLSLNPASLDERQDAAGHRSPDTTRLYDRSWRGKRAFALMPEVEDIAE